MSDQRKDSKADQSSPTSESHVIVCPTIGPVKVHVEGSRSSSEVVIMTVHDLGCDHTMYREFIEHPKMAGIRSRTIWVNIDVPGQGQNEPDLPADYQFPSMQQIGEDLVHVLNQLKFKEVICLGEGAGANIIARFAMAHIERVLGIVLMHATGTTSGLFESIKDKLLSWKLDPIKVNQSAESYLVLHRFGGTKFSKASDKDELKTIIEGYQEMLRTRTNAKNLKMFVEMFFNRSSLTESIKKITCPILLVTGQQSIFNGTTRSLHQAIMKECKDKTKVEFIEVAGVANVLEEKPDKLIECFQYFLQGLGVVSSVPMQNVAKPPRGRSMSMQEYDLPLRQRLFSAQLSSTPPIFDAPSCDSAENSTDPNSPANSPVGSPASGGGVGQPQQQLLSTSN